MRRHSLEQLVSYVWPFEGLAFGIGETDCRTAFFLDGADGDDAVGSEAEVGGGIADTAWNLGGADVGADAADGSGFFKLECRGFSMDSGGLAG